MILVDTSVLIEILRKNRSILNAIENLQSQPLLTTEINVLELLFGIHGSSSYSDDPGLKQKRIQDIISLLNNFTVLSFGRQAAMKTAELLGALKLEGNIIDFRDGMIAGIGLANGIQRIFTLNKKDFRRITGLQVID